MTYIPAGKLAEDAIKTLEEVTANTDPLTPKIRMAIPAQEMPSQDPAVRRSNMEEVALAVPSIHSNRIRVPGYPPYYGYRMC